MAIKLIHRMLSPFYAPMRNRLQGISAQLDRNAVLLGQVMSQHVSHSATLKHLAEAEFKVFSQFGEDGIIQYLISKVPIQKRIFVEFGVDNYEESNTRFLLVNNKWGGLVIEGNPECISNIRQSDLSWRCQLRAVSAFITQENINQVIKDAGIEGDIGILSIDIDGNDYWIWRTIDVVQPRIVICEFNRDFGCDYAVAIPYSPRFIVAQAHPLRLYFGASLRALCLLADQKGYDFVGCTSEGVNAFFVRKDLSANLVKSDARSGFASIGGGNHFESSVCDEIKAIDHMEVYDVETGSLIKLRDLQAPRR